MTLELCEKRLLFRLGISRFQQAKQQDIARQSLSLSAFRFQNRRCNRFAALTEAVPEVRSTPGRSHLAVGRWTNGLT
jgi:hypothetical protein